MPILAKRVGANNLNKYYLEQALLVYSIERPIGYLKKSKRINDMLNKIVKEEILTGEYKEKIAISDEEYLEIFD